MLALRVGAQLRGLGPLRGGRRQRRLHLALSPGDHRLHRPVQPIPQHPGENQEVHGLKGEGGEVGVHGRLVGVDEGIREQDEQRDDQAVDRHGLDHREAHEQGARERWGRFGLPCHRLHGRGDGPSFGQRGADRPQTRRRRRRR